METLTEYTITVERWDDQTGSWMITDEPNNQEKAEELVKDYMRSDEFHFRVTRYRIVNTTIQEFIPEGESAGALS